MAAIDDLYVCGIDDFICLAYQIILGRDADIDGMKHYRKAMLRGCSRSRVLVNLYTSGEANRQILGEISEEDIYALEEIIGLEERSEEINSDKIDNKINSGKLAILELMLMQLLDSRMMSRLGANAVESDLIPSGSYINEDAGRIKYSVRITGGLGDALIVARFIRDFQEHTNSEMEFDVYFHSPEAAKYFFQNILGFRVILHDRIFEQVKSAYDFSLNANQFLTFYNEHIKFNRITRFQPKVLGVFAAVEIVRNKIEKYISNHPNLDGAFADLAVKSGYKRYKYLHHMTDIKYKGDLLDIAGISSEYVKRYSLEGKRYITIHDGWDTKYDFQKSVDRPTKALPLVSWRQLVESIRNRFTEIEIVQLGAKTGVEIDGVNIQLKGKLSWIESLSILSRSILHIDTESGLVHAAAALGVRSTVFFGPTNLKWFSYDDNINIEPMICGNCWWSSKTWMEECPAEHEVALCMSTHDIEKAVDRLELTLKS